MIGYFFVYTPSVQDNFFIGDEKIVLNPRM